MSDTKTLLFFDTETSGVDAERNGILQIAWIIERNGEVFDECVSDVALPKDLSISLEALEINNFTLERMKKGRDACAVMEQLRLKLKSAVGGGPAAIPCGHNIKFDIDFLHRTAKRINAAWWCNFGQNDYLALRSPVCTLALCHYCAYRGILELPNYKLATLCGHFGIPLTPHDALADIRATRSLFYKLDSLLIQGGM